MTMPNSAYKCIFQNHNARPMIAWDDLANTRLLLYRTQQLQAAYDEHIQSVKKRFQSTREFVIQTLLENNTRTPLHLTPNHFPYDVEPGVRHLLLWDIHGGTPLEACRNLVHTYFPPAEFQSVLRLNRPSHRSVRDIRHYHVFIRAIKTYV